MLARNLFIASLLCLYTCTALCQCFNKSPYKGEGDVNSTFQYSESFMGCEMPAFVANTIDGIKISNASLRGKISMFYLWGIHDGFMKNDVPYLNQLIDTFRNDSVQFIAVNKEDPATWNKRAETFFKFKHIVDAKDFLSKFKCNPTLIIFDKYGKTVYLGVGQIALSCIFD
jgi:hypothetical protein